MTIARTIVLLAAALMLGACNLVVSETPVFSAVDSQGAPPFKPGIWASPDPGCDFKTSEPVDSWPKCANGTTIGETAIQGTMDPGSLAATDSSHAPETGPQKVALPYVLAAGDPRVMQVDMKLPDAPLGKFGVFYFVAVHPTAFGADGRITAAEMWIVQCGPPPPPQTSKDSDMTKGMVTQHPLPGLKVDNGECTPVNKAAVLRAAQASHAWADQVGDMHWVREADR
jgi:hypothetical protein